MTCFSLNQLSPELNQTHHKIINAEQTKQIHIHENTNWKILKTNPAAWFNKTEPYTGIYIHVKIKSNNRHAKHNSKLYNTESG